MAKRLICEGAGGAAWLPRWSERTVEGVTPRGSVLTEAARKKATDVESFGLDPALYIAVVETELGISGRVNLNGRIYPTAGFVEQNMRLAREIADGTFSPAELGHPDGMATLNVAARSVEVTMEDANGKPLVIAAAEFAKAPKIPPLGEFPSMTKAVGRIAFLRTPQGEQAFTLYKAGMAIGMSSVSYGEPVPHKIDEKSPYAADNAEHMGRTIDIIEGQELVRYDVVVDPSAGTFMRRESVETRRAYEALRATVTNLPPIQEAREAPKGESTMPFTDLKGLKAENPELFAKLMEEAAKANPFNGMTEEQQQRAAAVVKALGIGGGSATPTDDALTARMKEMVDAASGPMRARLTALEEDKAKETAARKVAEKAAADALAEVNTLKGQIAEREAKEARTAALTEAVGKVHKNLQGDVRSLVERQIAKGQITTKEQIAEAVADTEAAFKAVSKRTTEQNSGKSEPGDRGADPGEAQTSAAGGTAELSFEDIIAEQAIKAGGGHLNA